ncbi:endocuticle structural glycoprotein SgAbd-5-like [Anticarsia gemmatalis]|uniref:endocuticle structural glycoprotein SgAbd-5-like n=1 Tax=Anticarsia gemmatalis TaxID=129554 RepID=UPI003F75F48B
MKMSYIIVACALFSLATAGVIPEDAQAEIVSYDNTNDGNGNYRFSFVTSNGITREETGRLVNIGLDDEHIEVEGSYTYTDTEGKQVVVRYTADENGYQVLDQDLSGKPPFPFVPPSFAAPGINPNVVASLLG